MSSDLKQKSLSIKNGELKQNINKCLKQIKVKRDKIFEKSSFLSLCNNHSKIIDGCIVQIQQNAVNLSENLLKQQIKVSQSKQSSKIIKLYENKILEYRLQMQNKENFIQQAKLMNQNLFPQDHYLPDYSQMRKFFIESLHRDKLLKLLFNLSILKKQFHEGLVQLRQHQLLSDQYFQSRIGSNAAILKLIQKIREEERKQSDLKQKMRTYKQIIKVLEKESKGILQQIKNNAKINIMQAITDKRI